MQSLEKLNEKERTKFLKFFILNIVKNFISPELHNRIKKRKELLEKKKIPIQNIPQNKEIILPKQILQKNTSWVQETVVETNKNLLGYSQSILTAGKKPSAAPQKNMLNKFSKFYPPIKLSEPRLPEHLNYLQPTPTEFSISLGQLNQFIENPRIESIECNGPDSPIIIRTPQTITTEVTLSKEEIEEILNIFSQTASIPLEEGGVTRIVVGKLILTAIVSELVGSKFIIKKMRTTIGAQQFYNSMQRRF